jgi:hypothetical protein
LKKKKSEVTVIRKIKYPPKTGESEMTTMGSSWIILSLLFFFSPSLSFQKQQKPTPLCDSEPSYFILFFIFKCPGTDGYQKNYTCPKLVTLK